MSSKTIRQICAEIITQMQLCKEVFINKGLSGIIQLQS
jgi:hypothetical protein